GDPPDGVGAGLWVRKVVGSNTGGRLNPEEVIDDEFVSSRGVAEKVVEKQSTNGPVAIREPTQEGDGFTLVQKRNRRPENTVGKASKAAASTGVNLGRNLREIPKNKVTEDIRVSNRFGNLDEDMFSPDSQEVVIGSEENKENEVNPNMLRNGKNVSHGEGSSKSGNAVKEKGGPKEAFKSTKVGPSKAMGINGSRAKQNKITRPTRGLVFGPTKEELILSESGKRMRVETTSVGRAGGVFTANRANTMAEKQVLRLGEGNSGSSVTAPEEMISDRAMVIHSDPPDGEAVLLGK
ncbi:unnamed protein product, partial [Arabidopsis halleri]